MPNALDPDAPAPDAATPLAVYLDAVERRIAAFVALHDARLAMQRWADVDAAWRELLELREGAAGGALIN